MKILQRYLLQLFFPVFVITILFFILLLQLGDLFLNLAQYLQNQARFVTLLRIMYFLCNAAFGAVCKFVYNGQYVRKK